MTTVIPKQTSKQALVQRNSHESLITNNDIYRYIYRYIYIILMFIDHL